MSDLIFEKEFISMKTKEELNALKEEVENVNKKLAELTDEELNEVVGGQVNHNAQNGRSMMKVAEGAVSSTVEILRPLKDKVINAVNDTNTEVDRDAIQKEINASVQQIDDDALLTFNRKFLNN